MFKRSMVRENVGMKNRNMKRMRSDAEYVFLNMVVNKIPCWKIRKKCYQLFGMRIGDGARIGVGTIIVNPKGICIGNRSIVNEFCHLDGRGGLKIGKDVSISVYTTIITAGHEKNSDDFRFQSFKTKIGDNVWIGARAIILENSVIKDFAVIGAGCTFKGVAERKGIYIGAKKVCCGMRDGDKKYRIEYQPFFR